VRREEPERGRKKGKKTHERRRVEGKEKRGRILFSLRRVLKRGFQGGKRGGEEKKGFSPGNPFSFPSSFGVKEGGGGENQGGGELEEEGKEKGRGRG